jgi:hypothetical protein
MNPRYVAALVCIVTSLGLILMTVSGWTDRMKDRTEQRKRLRIWRKEHGIRQHPKAKGDAPMPFHVRTKLGDPGDPRTGISTSDTDNLFPRKPRKAK